MPRKLMAPALVAALIAAPIGFAGAADQQPSVGTKGPSTVPEQTAPEARPYDQSVGTDALEGSPIDSAIEGKDLAAEELRDKTVYDLEENEIGIVKDVNAPVGRDPQAIVEIGTIMGFGGKEVAVPVEHFQLSPDGRVVINLTRDELKRMPDVDLEDNRKS